MNFASLVVPQQFALGRAGEAFTAEGALSDDKTRQAVQGVLEALSKLTRAVQTA
jgi:chromate reductase